MDNTSKKIIGKCHICKQIKDCEYCSICNHWFCKECGFKIFSRAMEAVKEFIGEPEQGCCGESKSPKFAVIYSKKTGRIRRVSGLSNDIPIISPVKNGEEMVIFEEDKYADIHTLQDVISSITGLIPQDDRYAVVDDKGYVQGAIIADPDGCADMIPNMRLIKHSTADNGWIFDETDGFVNLTFIMANKKQKTSLLPERISLLSSDPKSKIIYTTDGTDPSLNKSETYIKEIDFVKGKLIKCAPVYKDKIGKIITLREPI